MGKWGTVSQPAMCLYTGGAVQSCSPGSASPAPCRVPWVLLPGLANETEPSWVYQDKGPNFPSDGAAPQGAGWQRLPPEVHVVPGMLPSPLERGQGTGGERSVSPWAMEGPRWLRGFPPGYFSRSPCCCAWDRGGLHLLSAPPWGCVGRSSRVLV